jgi:hypothetical protein
MPAPVVQRVGHTCGLGARIRAGLPGLGLQDVGEPLGVVEDPLLEGEQPAPAPARTHRLPLGLRRAELARPGGDGLGGVDRHRTDAAAVGGVAYVDDGDIGPRSKISHVKSITPGHCRGQPGGYVIFGLLACAITQPA